MKDYLKAHGAEHLAGAIFVLSIIGLMLFPNLGFLFLFFSSVRILGDMSVG